MFKITEGDFKNQTYGDESYLSNWPMLYILENGKQAYIGESNHVKIVCPSIIVLQISEFSTKYILFILLNLISLLHLIMSQSLIQYIVADELYEVRNKNAGMADKEILWKKRI